MKKIIFLFLFFLFINNTYANNIVDQYSTDYFYNVFENETWISKRFYFLTVDNFYSYCIELNKPILSSNYSEQDIFNSNLTVEQLKEIELYAYYGYGYDNNYDLLNYMATQELIWNFLGKQVIWSTEINRGGEEFNLEQYKNQILTRIYLHNLIPYFGAYSFDYTIGVDNFLYSKNNFLNNYTLIYEGPNDITKIDEGLIIKGYKVGSDSLILRKNIDKGKIRLYQNQDSQNILTFNKLEFDEEHDINLNINLYGNSLCFYRYDPYFDIYDQTFTGSLEDAYYDIFDENYNYLMTIRTDYNGLFCMEGFSIGDYIVRETIPSKGYFLNPNDIHFSIEFGENSKFIYLDAYRINSNIEIHNYFENQENQPILHFNLYRNGNYFYEFSNYNGVSNLYLEYGEYCVKQITNVEDYNKIEDFCFVIENNNPLYFYFHHNINEVEEIIEEEIDIPNNEEEIDVPNIELDNKEKTDIPNDEKEKNIEKIEKLPQLGFTKSFIPIFLSLLVLICLKKKLS